MLCWNLKTKIGIFVGTFRLDSQNLFGKKWAHGILVSANMSRNLKELLNPISSSLAFTQSLEECERQDSRSDPWSSILIMRERRVREQNSWSREQSKQIVCMTFGNQV